MEIYCIWSQAILNVGSERNIVLPQVVPQLNLKCLLETLPFLRVEEGYLPGFLGIILTMAIHEAPDIRCLYHRGTGSIQSKRTLLPFGSSNTKNLRKLPLPPVDRAQSGLTCLCLLSQSSLCIQDHQADLLPSALSCAGRFKGLISSS